MAYISLFWIPDEFEFNIEFNIELKIEFNIEFKIEHLTWNLTWNLRLTDSGSRLSGFVWIRIFPSRAPLWIGRDAGSIYLNHASEEAVHPYGLAGTLGQYMY